MIEKIEPIHLIVPLIVFLLLIYLFLREIQPGSKISNIHLVKEDEENLLVWSGGSSVRYSIKYRVSQGSWIYRETFEPKLEISETGLIDGSITGYSLNGPPSPGVKFYIQIRKD